MKYSPAETSKQTFTLTFFFKNHCQIFVPIKVETSFWWPASLYYPRGNHVLFPREDAPQWRKINFFRDRNCCRNNRFLTRSNSEGGVAMHRNASQLTAGCNWAQCQRNKLAMLIDAMWRCKDLKDFLITSLLEMQTHQHPEIPPKTTEQQRNSHTQSNTDW